ncbi:MAG: NAD-dependent deacetylase [Candidatus Pseudothioglobus sp.]|jgi:NAD-dependent deacetylase
MSEQPPPTTSRPAQITADWQAQIDALTVLLQSSSRSVVFSGAGISTESGIPDFRGPKGLWQTMTPIDFSDFVASEDVRRESWRRKFAGNDMAVAQPNIGHHAIAELVKRGIVNTVITQNVDGLHQKAGIVDDVVIEIHGNANYATCLSCQRRYEIAPIRIAFQIDEQVPYCTTCGGMIKTATISFGQAMPEAALSRAEHAASSCDVMLAIGSSLSVFPAAGLPQLARQQGAQLVIINNESTPFDAIANLVIHRPIGRTLSVAVEQLMP